MNGVSGRLPARARQLADWCVVAFGLTIPVWTLADSLLIAVLIPAWLCTGGWHEKLRRVRESPVALAIVAFVGLMALGTLWGLGGLEDRALGFKKYSELLFVPLLVSMAISSEWKERALTAFAASMAVTLVLSLGLAAGVLPVMGVLKGVPDNLFCPFKKHTTHNVLMAFASLVFALRAWTAPVCRWKWIWGGLAALAVASVLLMVQGRTGYVVLAALGIAVFHSAYRWKGTALATVLLAGMLAGAYMVAPGFHQRADLVVEGLQKWDAGTVAHDSVGERMEFVYHTLDIVRAHPLVGVGTGGFVEAYAEQVKGTSFPVTRHPHKIGRAHV